MELVYREGPDEPGQGHAVQKSHHLREQTGGGEQQGTGQNRGQNARPPSQDSLVLRRALRCFFLMVFPLGAAVVLLSDPISVYLLGDARTRLGGALLVP